MWHSDAHAEKSSGEAATERVLISANCALWSVLPGHRRSGLRLSTYPMWPNLSSFAYPEMKDNS